MNKLKLNLSDLAVESFDTGGNARPSGTVQGNQATLPECTDPTDCNNPDQSRSGPECNSAFGGPVNTCYANCPPTTGNWLCDCPTNICGGGDGTKICSADGATCYPDVTCWGCPVTSS